MRLALVLAVVTTVLLPPAPASATTFIQYPTLTDYSRPLNITVGPDGNLWFTESGAGNIGRITPEGGITEYPIPAYYSSPWGITTGPDGNLWFTDSSGNKVGRITPSGQVTEFTIPTADTWPAGITTGPDGNLWFTERRGNRIARATPTGEITEFALPTPGSWPYAITAGPDGNLWFTEYSADKIGRITPAGQITEFGGLQEAYSDPYWITAGPDGNLWFTELGSRRIGRITPAGQITEFDMPTPESSPWGITAGSDGNLWFTEWGASRIGRITPVGEITEHPIPAQDSTPHGITTGPDGRLWFTDWWTSSIWRATTLPSFDLSVTVEGPGSGMVTSSPAGIHCGTACRRTFDQGDVIRLTAAPNAANSYFAGWSGACSGTGTCEVTLSGETEVIATFARSSYSLRLAREGSGVGTVSSTPPGVCGFGCAASFPAGSSVALSAHTSAGSRFSGWGDDCAGSGDCSLTMDQDHVVSAGFTRLWKLRVTKTGAGVGTVTSSPSGISCGSACSSVFDQGILITLSASPSQGSRFAGWSGTCHPVAKRTCTIRVEASRQVAADFEPRR